MLRAGQNFFEIWQNVVFMIVLPVTLGATLGSLPLYFLGHFGGKPIIIRYGKWLGLSWQKVEKIEKKLSRGWSEEFVIFGLRAIPIFPNSAISGLCGLIRYPFKNYIIVTLFGSFVRAFVLAIIGWQIGEMYAVYARTISEIEKYVLFVFLGIGVFILIWLFRKKRFQRST